MADWKICPKTGKRSYPSGPAAARAAKKAKHRGNRVYRCPDCGGWHETRNRSNRFDHPSRKRPR